ncbi:Na/Pi cotransporter family protein [Stappia sp. GBMRC 2046]|uniref:Na/Pi cotransporter family protein n=1 Tax=Stappia sediminis TaxID=2692190 RepID=A0A7X3LUT6_9HYPH|nr:Na/Pi cotransporter family protein [Stappia sediminis]MXN65525.1 Na/Pi cotransporter family protein [Stappia sediminis]
MSGSVIFLNLAGAVALLLWATRMVRTGVERAYGASLKDALRRSVTNGPQAALAGSLLAVALQSSTAVALIVSGFVAGGHVEAGLGIAAILGADLGSALVARLLRFDLSLLIPVLLLAGMVAFRASEARGWRQGGRIMLGLGLLLLSLKLIGEASEPLRESEIMPIVLGYLSRDWVTAFLLAALMTWLFHSSVAAVLLVASLCDQHLIPVVLAVPVVLGINFGGAIIATVLTRGMERRVRIVPYGNIAIRGIGALALLTVQFVVGFDPQRLGANLGDTVVLMHIAFNAGVVIVGVPFARFLPGIIERLLPPQAAPAEIGNGRVTALNEADLDKPTLALANASRELLSMCERIDLMLTRVFELFRHPDQADLDALRQLDDQVDEIHADIKFYLARIPDELLDRKTRGRVNDLLGASIKLEQIADIVTKSMAAKVQKMADRGIEFSVEGWKELSAFHDEVVKNARLAFNVLVSNDVETARQVANQKEVIRRMEQDSETRHLERLREGLASSRETSSVHIDTIRDLKEINSLLVSMTYPVLEEAGMLRGTRLR